MSTPYTDSHGYPLTSTQALARMNQPKRRGYYNSSGRWVRLADKPKLVEKPANDNAAAPTKI